MTNRETKGIFLILPRTMMTALEVERKRRLAKNIQAVIKQILSDQLAKDVPQ